MTVLVKLLPEQIADWWDVLCPALEMSLPPVAAWGDPGRTNNIFSALQRGEMQCWQSYSLADGNGTKAAKIHGFAFTAPIYDSCSGTRNLLIYAACSVDASRPFLDAKWIEGIEVLRRYAKAKGFHQIVGYTDQDRVKQIVRRLGGEERTFITIPLEGE